MTDYIIRFVDGYGYMPIVEVDGVEVYRGEYQAGPVTALFKAENFMAQRVAL